MPTIPDPIRGMGRGVQVGPESAWTFTVATQLDASTTTACLSWIAPYGATATTVDTRQYYPNYYWGSPVAAPERWDWNWGDTMPQAEYARLATEQDARLAAMQEQIRMQRLEWEPTAAPPTPEDAEAAANQYHEMVQAFVAPPIPVPPRVHPPSEWAAAERRATALLLEHLTPEQRDEFTQHHYVTVQTAQYRYRLLLGRVGNIEELDATGRCVATLCVHPRANVPDADTVLTQLLYLRYEEDALRARANRSETDYGMRQSRQAARYAAVVADGQARDLAAQQQAAVAELDRLAAMTVAA